MIEHDVCVYIYIWHEVCCCKVLSWRKNKKGWEEIQAPTKLCEVTAVENLLKTSCAQSCPQSSHHTEQTVHEFYSMWWCFLLVFNFTKYCSWNLTKNTTTGIQVSGPNASYHTVQKISVINISEKEVTLTVLMKTMRKTSHFKYMPKSVKGLI